MFYKNRIKWFASSASLLILLLILPISFAAAEISTSKNESGQTKTSVEVMTPDLGIERLKKGNIRFVKGEKHPRDFLHQVKLTHAYGQTPFALILSCMDSRTSAELIFDQGIGDIFSVRVAGNIIDPDQLGSMEYAVAVSSAKLIIVMGHTHCGAVQGACKGVQLGHLTQLLSKIRPAKQTVAAHLHLAENKLNCEDEQIVDAMALQNVLNTMNMIKTQSPVIRRLLKEGKIKIVGAMYDLSNGEVKFFDPR